MRFFAILLFCAAVWAPGANAATIAAFSRTTNDGVYTLTAAQIDYFGVPSARYIAFLRPRFNWFERLWLTTRDSFNARTIVQTARNRHTRNSILAVLNGNNPNLDYTGGYLEALGETRLNRVARGYYRGSAFLFGENVGNLVFARATFHQRQSRGALDFEPPGPSPVLVPPALPLLGGAVALLALARRARRGPISVTQQN